MVLSRQTLALAVIGLADLVSTLWFLGAHGAEEANPLMGFFLAQGVFAFVGAKLVLLGAPLAALEWARRHRPVFVRRASTVAVAAYLGLYAVGVMGLNRDPARSKGSVQPPPAWRAQQIEAQRRMVFEQLQHEVQRKLAMGTRSR